MKISIFAPATIANFSVGFDSLGTALSDVDGSLFGDVVSIESVPVTKIHVTGPFAYKLPLNPDDNLVSKCSELFHRHLTDRGILAKTFFLTLEKRMPIGSGLGSSASSIVAALVALNRFYNQPFNDSELLIFAGEMEGVVSGSVHYDNVAPCLFGGVQLITPDAATSTALPFFADWVLVLYHPGIEVPTEMARAILPENFPRAAAILYWQKLACFVHASYAGDGALAAKQMQDMLIEPYRAVFIPHFHEGRCAALDAGALAFGISGSGPTCFAVADSLEVAQRVRDVIVDAMQGTKDSFSKICTISKTGAFSV
ncbi:MAG: homoserine kinase [Pseudomonadota bacterium]